MRYRAIVLLACSLILSSCDRSPSGVTTQPQVTVAIVDGLKTTHTFHRGVALDSFLKTLPSGSVDFLDVSDAQPYVIAVVQVRQADGEAKPPAGGVPHEFQTTFHGKGATESTKKWKPAEGNNSGTWTAVFVLPDSMETGETRLVSESTPDEAA
jgi:hypothetical protein